MRDCTHSLLVGLRLEGNLVKKQLQLQIHHNGSAFCPSRSDKISFQLTDVRTCLVKKLLSQRANDKLKRPVFGPVNVKCNKMLFI